MVRKHLSRFGLSSQRYLWGGESPFKSPALRHPVINLMGRHAIFTTPLSNCLRLAMESLESVFARIIALLNFIYPSTVARGVISVIINTIKLISFIGLFPHVFKKILKSELFISPTIANFYPPPPVPLIVDILRVSTPSIHRSEGVIFIRMEFSKLYSSHIVNSIGCFYE